MIHNDVGCVPEAKPAWTRFGCKVKEVGSGFRVQVSMIRSFKFQNFRGASGKHLRIWGSLQANISGCARCFRGLPEASARLDAARAPAALPRGRLRHLKAVLGY